MHNELPIKLHVRPFAHDSESILGYLLRLGWNNGLPKSTYLFELLGLSQLSRRNVGSLGKVDIQEVYKAICASTGRDNLILQDELDNYDLHFPPLSNAVITFTQVTQPRVCLKCMQSKEPYLPWYWQSILVSHCPKHATRLISECPNKKCAHPLSWEPALLNGCPKCHTRWTDMSELQLMSPTTDLEHRVVTGLTNRLHPEIQFYADLSRAMMLVARSFDFMSERLISVPESQELSKIINAAYWLITSVEFEIFYKNLKYIELGRICVFANQAIASLNDFQFNSELAKEAYGSEHIDPHKNASILQFDDPSFLSKRRKRACNVEPEGARLHLDGKALGMLLGDYTAVIPTLREERVLTPIYNTRADQDQIFNAGQLMDLALGCLTDTIPENYLSVRPCSTSLREHFNTYIRVLCWVLSGQLKGCIHPDSGFNIIFVDPLPFTILSRHHLGSVCNDPIPLTLAAQVLGLETEEIKALVQRGKLRLAKYSRSDWTLDGPKFYQYAISNRIQYGAEHRRAALTKAPAFH